MGVIVVLFVGGLKLASTVKVSRAADDDRMRYGLSGEAA